MEHNLAFCLQCAEFCLHSKVGLLNKSTFDPHSGLWGSFAFFASIRHAKAFMESENRTENCPEKTGWVQAVLSDTASSGSRNAPGKTGWFGDARQREKEQFGMEKKRKACHHARAAIQESIFQSGSD
ncbi:hypothetical protein [Yeguia hominis]|uniref:Uncharacterized protein n=1 Tax=Yeguia hominis TaxID=2763662 RepID=A0A926D9Q5_9FIRM|nr:hypothetical protein [Yeguia hominis]MBC8533904.1 hypothetical protein [Yeguia hominis]